MTQVQGSKAEEASLMMHQAAAFSQEACLIVKARNRSVSAACLGPQLEGEGEVGWSRVRRLAQPLTATTASPGTQVPVP